MAMGVRTFSCGAGRLKSFEFRNPLVVGLGWVRHLPANLPIRTLPRNPPQGHNKASEACRNLTRRRAPMTKRDFDVPRFVLPNIWRSVSGAAIDVRLAPSFDAS